MSRKFTLSTKTRLSAHGQSNVFHLKNNERESHVLMKAFIWALYLPQYPDLTIEVYVGDRYKPDVVSIDEAAGLRDVNGRFRFWGESGRVGRDKIFSLAKRYPDTHLVIAKWESNLKPLEQTVRKAVADANRTAPFDLLRFERGDAERFIDSDGNITLSHDDIQWVRIPHVK